MIRSGCHFCPSLKYEMFHYSYPTIIFSLPPIICKELIPDVHCSHGWGFCLDDVPKKKDLKPPFIAPGVIYDVHHQCQLQYGPNATYCDQVDVSSCIQYRWGGSFKTKQELSYISLIYLSKLYTTSHLHDWFANKAKQSYKKCS